MFSTLLLTLCWKLMVAFLVPISLWLPFGLLSLTEPITLEQLSQGPFILMCASCPPACHRAAARANKPAPPYEVLPRPLPQKPLELASLLLRRLRQVDKTEQQFTKAHEKLLLLQVNALRY